ncbi:unnamed protein product, partial [Protopolystoma xenopodis]
MAPLTEGAGKTFGNVPSQWCNAGNHGYYGRGHRTRYVPQGLPDAPTKLRKQVRTNTIKLKETSTKQKQPKVTRSLCKGSIYPVAPEYGFDLKRILCFFTLPKPSHVRTVYVSCSQKHLTVCYTPPWQLPYQGLAEDLLQHKAIAFVSGSSSEHMSDSPRQTSRAQARESGQSPTSSSLTSTAGSTSAPVSGRQASGGESVGSSEAGGTRTRSGLLRVDSQCQLSPVQVLVDGAGQPGRPSRQAWAFSASPSLAPATLTTSGPSSTGFSSGSSPQVPTPRNLRGANGTTGFRPGELKWCTRLTFSAGQKLPCGLNRMNYVVSQ